MNSLAALLLLAALSGTAALPAQASDSLAADERAADDRPAAQSPAAATADQPATILPDGPPAGSLSLSQIIAQIESRPDFAFIRDIDWQDGRYDVEYRTRDGRDRDLKIDPRTGRSQESALPQPRFPAGTTLTPAPFPSGPVPGPGRPRAALTGG